VLDVKTAASVPSPVSLPHPLDAPACCLFVAAANVAFDDLGQLIADQFWPESNPVLAIIPCYGGACGEEFAGDRNRARTGGSPRTGCCRAAAQHRSRRRASTRSYARFRALLEASRIHPRGSRWCGRPAVKMERLTTIDLARRPFRRLIGPNPLRPGAARTENRVSLGESRIVHGVRKRTTF
jgi:hypothetical protein